MRPCKRSPLGEHCCSDLNCPPKGGRYKTAEMRHRYRLDKGVVGPCREDLLAGFLSRNLRAFFPGLGEPDGNGLFSAFYPAPFAAPARFQRSTFFTVHGTLHALARRSSVSGHSVSPFLRSIFHGPH